MAPLPKVLIIRDERGPLGCFGKLIAPAFECYTLERPESGDHPCIPPGTYKATMSDHPHWGVRYELPVKERTGILIHPANWYDQLLGCIALGRSVQEVEGKAGGIFRKMKGITSSADAVAAFEKQMGGLPFELTVQNKEA